MGSEQPKDLQRLLILPVASVVLLVWLASSIYSFISKEYVPLTITTPVMLVLAGYVFGFRTMVRAIDKSLNNGEK